MKIRQDQRTGSWLAIVLGGAVIAPCLADVAPAQPAINGVKHPSPLRVPASQVEDARGPAIALEFEQNAYADLRHQDVLTLTDFVLPGEGRRDQPRTTALELTRLEVFSPDARFVIGDPARPGAIKRELDAPDLAMFRGHIADDPDSRVFLSISPRESRGYIMTAGRTILLSAGPRGGDHPMMIYDLNAIPRGMIQWRDFVCDAKAHEMPAPFGGLGNPQPATMGEPLCRRVDIAIETDFEFTNDLFGGDLNAASAYVATLLGASSEIFTDQINAELEVTFVRLWDEPDPWGGNSTINQLFEFQDYWNDNMNHIDRHLAHYLSGRELGGGVAYLEAVCHSSNGYGLSANIGGSFPYPLENFSEQNWDIMVVTHEIGHNFGTTHTHNYCPPLDQCPPQDFWGNCQDQTDCSVAGTIMSYCHLCEGGLANILLEFHPTVRATMIQYLDNVTNCNLSCVDPLEVVNVPDDAQSISDAMILVADGGEVIVEPGTYNEQFTISGKSVHLRSTGGPEATVINAAGSSGSVMQIVSASGNTVTVEGFTFTGGTGSEISIGGTTHLLGGGAYINASEPEIINCIFTDNTATFGGGLFINSANPTVSGCLFEDNESASSGGAIFNFSGSDSLIIDSTFINNVANNGGGGGISNQSSSPTITDCTFITNQAVNGGGVRNISSSAPTINNCAFELNTASDSGGGVYNDSSPGTTILNSTFCENQPEAIDGGHNDGGGNEFAASCTPTACPADITGAGHVDVDDLLIVLNNWGECGNPNDCPADVTGTGVVDVDDLLIILNNWGECPDA